MKNQVFFFLYFLLYSCYGSILNSSHELSYDSVITNIKVKNKDTNCVLYLLESANKLKRENKYLSMSLLEESDKISKKLNYIHGLALSKLYMSEIDRAKGNNDIALKNCLLAIALLDSMRYTGLLPSAYNDLAQIYFDIGRKEEAFEKNKLAYLIAEKNMNQHQMGRSLTNIGVHYAELKEYDKALSYFKKCELIALNTKSDYGYALTLINLGSCYYNLNKHKIALMKYNQAIEICEKYDYRNNLIYRSFYI